MLDRTGRKNHRNPSIRIHQGWFHVETPSDRRVSFHSLPRRGCSWARMGYPRGCSKLGSYSPSKKETMKVASTEMLRSWFRRLSSTLRSTQQRIPTRRRESNDFAIIIARIHLACDSYQEYFSFHLLHWWQINVPDRNGRLVPSKIPNFWNYYVKHGFI